MATAAIAAERQRVVRRAVARAGSIGLAAVAVGFLAQLLFFDTGLGINFPIAIVAVLACAWFVPARPTRWPRLADAWLPLAAVALAAFVAVRGDRTLIALDVLGSITLTTLALASFGGMRVVQRPFVAIVALGLRAIGTGAAAGSDVIDGLRRGLPMRQVRLGASWWPGVLRGLMLAIPLLLVFAVLFASADAVFARMLSDLFAWDLDLGSLPGRLVTALAAAWLTAGLLVFVSRGRESDEPVSTDGQAIGRLGSTEATTVLVVLNLLFAFFVVLQAAYLFGGRSTLDASGLTYAEYARRGFFELLAVALAVGALVLALEAFVGRRSAAYLATILALVGLTVIVLGSAFLRLRLYLDAYGWTELRFYVMAAIGWLAIGAAGAAVCIGLDRTRWLPHGLVMLAVAFGLAFNIIGPVRFIAEQNIARVADGTLSADAYDGVDLSYLAFLGDDALAVIAERYPDGLPPSVRTDAQYLLEGHARRLANDPSGDDWQAWNLSRERIRALLSRDGLLR
ncbi:MAG TPA: DUF4173 domain-containing protein [Candidatus Limnocylindrales bacterium]|nr:DUF4173 domain-containing protein [Candidatus Limnocylindrales bacterium]